MTGKFEMIQGAVSSVSRETYAKLLHFERRFKQWNSKINLVAPSTLDTFWERHIVDSAQLYIHIGCAKTLVDLGSGGGFPALVLAILYSDTADMRFHLIESNRKKASFLTLIASELELNVVVIPKRVEQTYTLLPAVDIVTSRALADLDKLLEFSAPWFDKGAHAYFQKGREYRSEIQKSRKRWQFDLLEHKSSINTESVILHVSNVKNNVIAGE